MIYRKGWVPVLFRHELERKLKSRVSKTGKRYVIFFAVKGMTTPNQPKCQSNMITRWSTIPNGWQAVTRRSGSVLTACGSCRCIR
ncbi:hypothetical protein [Klebsiella phage Kpn74]|uniref:Uncharacterized protein n=1 Tax=Klebsiella phage Kpn74 TaxID=3044026 RepID=A0AAT9V576_9CAUD|nr:hypothetical protein [Klebsiella phage Kpn74]